MNIKIAKINDFLLHNTFRFFWIFTCFLIIVTFFDLLFIINLSNFDFFIQIFSQNYLNPPLFVGNDDTSARYLLSAIAQAQAAVIALVVTVTLVAIQLTSQTYSARIIYFFRSYKNYPFWLLLILYFISIIYDIIVLGSVDGMNRQLENRISYTIFLSSFAFMALIPFTRNVLYNLNPENVINNLMKNIDKKMNEGTNLISAVDIIKRAIKVYDLELYHNGIDKLFDFFKSKYDDTKDDVELIQNFCNILDDISNFSFAERNEDAIIKVENILGDMYAFIVNSNNLNEEIILELIMKSFKNIGILSIEHDMKGSTYKMINCFMDIGLINSKKGLWYPTTWAVDSLGIVGINIAKRGFFESGTAVYAIRYICDSAYQNELNHINLITDRAKDYTEEIKMIAKNEKLDSVVVESEDALKMYEEISRYHAKKQVSDNSFTEKNILVIDNNIEDEQIGIRSFMKLSIPFDNVYGNEIKRANLNKYDLIYISSFANIKNELTEIKKHLNDFLEKGGCIIVMCQSPYALGQSPSGKRIILHGIGDYSFLPDDPKYVHRQTRVFGDSIIIKNSDLFKGIFSKGSIRQMTAGDSVGYFSAVDEWNKLIVDNEGNTLAACKKFGNGLIFVTTLYPDFRLVESSYDFFEAGIFIKSIIKLILES